MENPLMFFKCTQKNLVNLHTRTHMLSLQTCEHTHLSYPRWQKVELGERHDPGGFQFWKSLQWERRELLTPSTGELRNNGITNKWTGCSRSYSRVIDLARSLDLCCTCGPTRSCGMDRIQMSSISCVGMFCCVGQAWCDHSITAAGLCTHRWGVWPWLSVPLLDGWRVCWCLELGWRSRWSDYPGRWAAGICRWAPPRERCRGRRAWLWSHSGS